MTDDRANLFLNLIRRSQRGRLKVYLGYGPGVGKTTLMLQEGHRLLADGIDVVIGLVETHGRAGTASLVTGLELMPRKSFQYHGIQIEEMDLAAVLTRRPQVVLVDELAHTNVPGCSHEKRYQDVQDLLEAGTHVISTMNIQHLESLYDTVERQIGVKVRERIPDAVLAEADQVVNVDLAPDDLQHRLELGQIYPKDRIPSAMQNFFKSGNLEQLRELTLRELASQIDVRRREMRSQEDSGAPDQIMVCLSSRGPNSARLLRYASRLAGRLNRNWYAVYVQTPTEDPLSIDAQTQRLLAETLTLAHQLGAMVFTYKGADVVETLLRFAKEYRVGHIVIGKPRPVVWWKRALGARSVAERLLFQARSHSLVVIDVDHSGLIAGPGDGPDAPAAAPAVVDAPDTARQPLRMSTLVKPTSILVWNQPLERTVVLRQLVEALAIANPGLLVASALARLEAREQQGSTFLNDGLALPHALLPGPLQPLVALGLPHAGISDLAAGSVRVVVLILSPSSSQHLEVLALTGRLFRHRDLLRRLDQAVSAEQVLEEIRRSESTTSA